MGRTENSPDSHVLITGGAGYVGSPLVDLLLRHGHRVTVFDNLIYGGESLLNYWRSPRFQFVHGDLTARDDVARALSGGDVTAVVHLAAIVGDPACAQQPELAERVNWRGSMNLLEIAREAAVERFLFASTCSNYGRMADPDGLVDETSPLEPVSHYARLKVRFEEVILTELDRDERFCPTCLRFSTVYGASPRMRFDLTVNEFTKELALGRDLEVFGEQFWRPYCHVHDFARAMLTVLQAGREKVAYDVFNVGDTRENYRKQAIVEEITRFLPEARVRYVQRDEDPRNYRVSFDKIQRELGFRVSSRVPDGIQEILELIRSGVIKNPDDARYRNS